MELKHKKLIGLGITGTGVLSIALAVAITSRNGLLNIHNAKGTAEPKSLTLSNTDLKNVTLADFDIPDNRGAGAPETKHDKKFKITRPDGKYIIGAVVYHDCGYQYIGTRNEANASLGDAFTMDNVTQPEEAAHGQNAFNFHIIFALDNIDSISYNFDVAVTDYNVEKTNAAYFTAVKVRQYSNPDNTDAYFYSDITTKGYKGVVDNTDGDTTYFDDAKQAKTTERTAYHSQVTHDNYQNNNVGTNMVAIQFNYAGRMFAAEKVISFTFTSITFNYHCN